MLCIVYKNKNIKHTLRYIYIYFHDTRAGEQRAACTQTHEHAHTRNHTLTDAMDRAWSVHGGSEREQHINTPTHMECVSVFCKSVCNGAPQAAFFILATLLFPYQKTTIM